MFGKHSAKFTRILLSAICAAAVVGCSSEGGSGGGDEGTDRASSVSSESTLNQENLHQVSQSALQAAETAVNVDMGVVATNEVFGLGGAFSSSNIGNGSDIYQQQTTAMRSVASSDRNAEFLGLIPVEFLSFLCSSGSITAIQPASIETLGLSFNDCAMDGVYIDGQMSQAHLNGDAYLTISNYGDAVTIGYNDFSVSWLDESIDLGTMSFSCTGITSGEFSCDADIVEMLGLDGREYLLSDISLLGDALAGYDIEALLNDPVNGTFELSTEDITFNCENGHPDSGSVMVSAEDGSSASISFPSCSEYTVCLNDVCETQTWSF